MGKKLIFLFLFALILFPLLVNAQPPPQQNINTNVGLDIDFAKIDIIEANKTHSFNFHVFNRSNGLRLDNISVICRFHLTNISGVHTVEEDLDYVTAENDWEITLTSLNFSKSGAYSIQVNCNDGGFGGFVEFSLLVTPTGFLLGDTQIFYAVLLTILFFIDLLFLFIIFTLDIGNPKDERGNFVGISLKKYGKVAMIGVFYGLILVTLNLMNAIAQSIVGISQFAGIIGGLFLLMLGAAWVWTISIVIWIGIMIWNDGGIIKEVQKRMKLAGDQFG